MLSATAKEGFREESQWPKPTPPFSDGFGNLQSDQNLGDSQGTGTNRTERMYTLMYKTYLDGRTVVLVETNVVNRSEKKENEGELFRK